MLLGRSGDYICRRSLRPLCRTAGVAFQVLGLGGPCRNNAPDHLVREGNLGSEEGNVR